MNTNKIKYLFIGVLFTILVLPGWAQQNYKVGYVVNASGDTLKGRILLEAWKKAPEKIKFKATRYEGATSFSAIDIKSFSCEGRLFKSEILETIPGLGTLIKSSGQKSPRIFLEIVVMGEKSLYAYGLNNDNELLYYASENGYKNFAQDQATLTFQLSEYLTDVPKEELASTTNKRSDLVTAFMKYYSNQNSSPNLTYTKSRKEEKPKVDKSDQNEKISLRSIVESIVPKFKPGYIVTNEGDSIFGDVAFWSLDSNPKNVKFERSWLSNESVEYDPLDIKAFGSEKSHYRSAITEVEMSSQGMEDIHLYQDPNLKLETDTLFLETIVSGPKELHYLRTDDGRKLFYFTYNDQIRLLYYKIYYDFVDPSGGAGGVKSNLISSVVEVDKYKGQLNFYLGECKSIGKAMRRLEYNTTSLTNLYQKYYECMD